MPHRTKIVFAVLVLIVLGLFGLKLRNKSGSRGGTPSQNQPDASGSGQPTIEIAFASPTPSNQVAPTRKFVNVVLGDLADFSVELATTPDEITQGLSGRTTLSSDGMLFVISPPARVSFWMRSMRFPLDMIWIRSGKIIGIEGNLLAPTPGTQPQNVPTHSPPFPVDYVLELPGGVTKQLGIVPGMAFTIR